MKETMIQISLEEVEELKQRIAELEEEIEEQNNNYKKLVGKLGAESNREKALKAALNIADGILSKIFYDLGFCNEIQDKGIKRILGCLDKNWDIDHYLGERWWTHDALKVTLSVQLSENIKNVFLRLGIDTDKLKKKKKDDILDYKT